MIRTLSRIEPTGRNRSRAGLLPDRRAFGIACHILVLLLIWTVTDARADGVQQTVAPGDSLQRAIDETASGDALTLEAGLHQGPVVVDKPLTLRGRPGAVVDGDRNGSVISVRADDVRIENLRIRGSGLRLGDDDAGIHSSGDRTVLVGNRIESCLHGIYFREVEDGRIEGNTIVGATGGAAAPAFDLLSEGAPSADPSGLCAVGRLNENRRGNGVHLWSSRDILIADNRIARTRDGVYFSFTDHCEVRGNEVRETRYGLHYMYSDGNAFYDNRFTANAAGAALMYSGDLEVRGNRFVGNRGRRAYGLLLQSVDDSLFAGNVFEGNTVGVYAENSQNNGFRSNHLDANYVALRMGGSSRDNRVAGNHFSRNLHPAEAEGQPGDNRWSVDGQGNRWPGHPPPDLDADGVGDFPHREADPLGDLRARFPLAGLLSGSSGLEMLRLAAARSRMPGIRAIEDPHPLAASVK